MNDDKHSLSTRCIHGGRRPAPDDCAVVMPIYQTSTYIHVPADQADLEAGRPPATTFYSRMGNPTVAAVERRIADLEGAEEARLFASGNAASHAAVMGCLANGGHLLASMRLYGGTREMIKHLCANSESTVSFVDLDDEAAVLAACNENTRAILCESVANPTLELADVPALARFARTRSLKLIVDATFATPCLQRPLELGADLVMHSASKYYGGHSDLIGGVLAGSAQEMAEVTRHRSHTGACMDPHAAFLVDRGIKTLALRMRAHCTGALEVARFLEGHEAVEAVLYPGLRSFPHHERAQTLLAGFGGVLMFTVGGDDKSATRVLEALRLALPAVSLGGVETLVSQPAYTSHTAMSVTERTAVGIPPGSIRVSVGIEDPKDLIVDLDQALSVLQSPKPTLQPKV
jgi:cystathionine beta-lyase/cystathionine gamma-synthase